MTEPPSKRLKQRSLTEFAFTSGSKLKIQVQAAKFSKKQDIPVITISDNQSEDKEQSTDDKMAAHESTGKKLDAKEDCKEDSELLNMYKNVNATIDTKSSQPGQSDMSSIVGRKRLNSDILSTPPNTSSGVSESTTDKSNSKTNSNEKGTDETQSYGMSPDLFSDSEQFAEDSQEQEDVIYIPPSEHTEALGLPIKELKTTLTCSLKLPPLNASSSHTVLFRVPYSFGFYKLRPYPDHWTDKWDNDHVRMPCSRENEYPVHGQVRQRWDLIEKALKGDLGNPFKLEHAILSYNTRYSNKWDFYALERVFSEFCYERREKFFKTTVKKMAMLALRLPNICTQPIPMLKKGKTHSITLSQLQISCLLANAFFCTFPRRNAHGRNSEYSSYPDINFNSLFAGHSSRKVEKLKCILAYFTRVTDCEPDGTVTFTRQALQHLPDWAESRTQLTKLHVATDKKIEDDGEGMLQVDFANKFIGGGALSRGLVQEEIRFMICPEMIVSRLFTEVLEKNECLIMTGCERYSNYTGYSDSFSWSSDHIDQTERDEWGRRRTEVVAIDAMVIRNYSDQFKAWCVKREMDKAYCGFYNPHIPASSRSAVCTGNWGCGAFGGEKQLKALIQLMAAAEAGRDVCYFTFHDVELQKELFEIHSFLKEDKNHCIGGILKIISQYYINVCQNCRGHPEISLFEYIRMVVEENMSNKGELSEQGSFDYKANTP
ncbi:poly(ADP-ribose) glycohydrolase-like [Liolophura sinensis]|uniref:poly(ADP-ribose) glycohydrolase-like n=1 Tax=Liolophura sinensis TaxID=3198878 RepID=UPI003158E253